MTEAEEVEAELMRRFEERFDAMNRLPGVCPRCRKRHAIFCSEGDG